MALVFVNTRPLRRQRGSRYARENRRRLVDDDGVAHYATRMTKRSADELFRLADMTRLLVGCTTCGVDAGAWCRRKSDGRAMANHSSRVDDAKVVVNQRFVPLYGRLHLPLCATDPITGIPKFAVHKPAPDGREVDCMACITCVMETPEENTK